jgi:hypothetical protein
MPEKSTGEATSAHMKETENYASIRPAILQLRRKYPEYDEPKWFPKERIERPLAG